jgi:hypothetical protein
MQQTQTDRESLQVSYKFNRSLMWAPESHGGLQKSMSFHTFTYMSPAIDLIACGGRSGDVRDQELHILSTSVQLPIRVVHIPPHYEMTNGTEWFLLCRSHFHNMCASSGGE